MEDSAPSPFAWHDGSIEGLDPLYLPSWFVHAFVAGRHVVIAAALAAVIGALAIALRERPDEAADRRRARPIAALLALAAFLLAFPLHDFPDEVFVTFRHARMLAEEGMFSFERDRPVDGTVELLQPVVLAGLAKIGLEPAFGALLLGAACSAATIAMLVRLASRSGAGPFGCWLTGALAVVTPAVVGLGGSGWSSPIAGLLTVASIAAWLSPRWERTFALLAALSLLRYDFAFYTVAIGALAVVAGALVDRRPMKRLLLCWLASLLAPAAMAAFWRLHFGHWLPTPLVFKAGVALDHGMALGKLHFRPWLALELTPAVVAFAWLVTRRSPVAPSLAAWIVPGVVHVALVEASGGDYLGRYHRYYTVLVTAGSCAVALAAGAAGRRASAPFPRRPPAAAGLGLAAVVGLFAATGLARDVAIGVDAAKTPWFGQGASAMTESRLTNHTATARFFTRVLREESHWKLASLEVGSFFHWIDAIPTDLLGFVNRDVATGPVNTRPSDRIWDRRLDPAFWARERPEIVWIDTKTRGDPLGAILEFADAASAGGTTPAMKDFLSLSRHWFWTEPYFDDAAFSAGWLPRMTAVNERWLVLWLVRADVADAVDRDLKAAGFLRKF